MRAAVLFAAIGLALLTPAGALAADAKKEKGAFVPVDTLTAMVAGPLGRHQVMTVQAGVNAPDPVLRAYAESVTPRLRDAYVQVLQAYATGLTPGNPPDPEYLGRRMQEATDRVLGRAGARFLFGGVMIN